MKQKLVEDFVSLETNTMGGARKAKATARGRTDESCGERCALNGQDLGEREERRRGRKEDLTL